MKRYNEIKKDLLNYSVISLKMVRTAVDFGISILERSIDDNEKKHLYKKEKKRTAKTKKIKRINIE